MVYLPTIRVGFLRLHLLTTSYTKRRKQIWEALHPVEQVAHVAPPVAKHGHAQEKSFAASTAEATGQSKATTNRAIARAEALGDEALTKVAHTSLDKGITKRHPIPQFEGGSKNTTPSTCLLYTSPSPRDRTRSRMPSSA